MPTAEIDIEIYCGECGSGLCLQTEFALTRIRKQPSFRVDPCQDCIKDAVKDAVEDSERKKDREIAGLQDEIDKLKQEIQEEYLEEKNAK